MKTKKVPMIEKSESRLQMLSVFIVICFLTAGIHCQDLPPPSNGQQTQLTATISEPIKDEFVSVDNQLEPNCFEKCQGLEFYYCSICYKQCEYPNGTTFDMKTCQFKACTWYDIFPYSEDNPTSTFTRCTQWETKMLPQQECIGNCCGAEATYEFFTPQTMQQCVEANIQQKQSDSTVIAIVAASLSALFLTIIFLVIFCWCRHEVMVCFKNILYFFQRLCPCTDPEKKSKKQSTNDQSQDSKKNTRQLRNRRQWETKQKKQYLSQLPSSKYIIESKYEINPEIYCPVCLDDQLNCQTKCKHRMHFQCLRQSLKKKMKCPECSSRSFNPIKIKCEKCNQKQTQYSIDKKNVDQKYPDFYHDGKIYCDSCYDQKYKRRN